jgi:hypothetical protein
MKKNIGYCSCLRPNTNGRANLKAEKKSKSAFFAAGAQEAKESLLNS